MASPYRGFTVKAHIHFDYSPTNAAVPFTDDVSTAVRIAGANGTARTFHPIIDTGSCGFVISAVDLPDWTKEEAARNPPGWEFLSSSKILYSGHWIPRDVAFTNAKQVVVARVPLLAVESKVHCPGYNATRDRDACPAAAAAGASATPMPSNIRVLGVGFGREHDGMPQGTPDKNAFINVRSIGGLDVAGSPDFRNGYIVDRAGVTVGLTEENTARMRFAKLDVRPGAADARDWDQVLGAVAIDGSSLFVGKALVDTGVSQMYATVPKGTKVKRTKPPVLDDASFVELRIGPLGNGGFAAQDNFTVGQGKGQDEGIVPSSVRVTLADPEKNAPHLNTGRHFLRRWETAFDCDGGFFGLRRVQEHD
ncbi:uncharacterized protein UV8b_05841 [Ustilaginoidea virens]|uniref:Uncharacterized protein n=1 Tax=Ustilaginoidea virens TaxID=1159556 RepID=A0A063C792_USTVR|nr:uncharacterized protein UV8b_05841 [Ustilaginoidea virens]QUC21598.1 hypothetical protein UV8b_05841 [Ustilaginoidea virens]GAO13568.1 hypothetical protein UVI_02015590 [Ustilaginoidea virens]